MKEEPDRLEKGLKSKEYIANIVYNNIALQKLALERFPRHQYDLLINIAVCMFRMFQGD